MSHRFIPLKLTLAAAAVLCAGCQTVPTVREPMRAIWVTRGDYRTAEDVQQIMADCADAGFNTILFQVRGNGTAFYKSNYEPWAEQFKFKDPGFDPLAVAVREAKKQHVDLHAWVNVMPAWKGTLPPQNPEQLYNQHPEWFWYDQHGNRQALSSFYVSLNPCLPEVRQYLTNVFREIVQNYPVAGLHLDYIRFPNEPPATPANTDIDYPYDARTLALYKEATGKTPQDDKDAWNAWRTECVHAVVSDLHKMLRKERPQAVLSASVGAAGGFKLRRFQDPRVWRKEGSIDALVLMNYTDDPDEFSQRIDTWLTPEAAAPATDGSRFRDAVPATVICPGAWFGRHPNKTATQAAEVVQAQLEIARQKTGNFCIFSYSSLFDGRNADADGPRAARGKEQRAARRTVIVPYVQQCAAEARQ